MARRPAKRVKKRDRSKDLIRLNLACGQVKMPGYIGVDIAKTPAADVVHDLMKFPWPFKDNAAVELHISHFLEHIPILCIGCNGRRDPLFEFMDECYRVLAPGGKITVISPYYSSARAWQDPTHRRAISEWTFLYFNKKWREENGLDHYPITCDYDFQYGYNLAPHLLTRNEEYRATALLTQINAALDIQVTMTKR
jgi:predicted SAM-dependent methyltransferase